MLWTGAGQVAPRRKSLLSPLPKTGAWPEVNATGLYHPEGVGTLVTLWGGGWFLVKTLWFEACFKMLHRWYTTPVKIANMSSNASNNCWKCNDKEGPPPLFFIYASLDQCLQGRLSLSGVGVIFAFEPLSSKSLRVTPAPRLSSACLNTLVGILLPAFGKHCRPESPPRLQNHLLFQASPPYCGVQLPGCGIPSFFLLFSKCFIFCLAIEISPAASLWTFPGASGREEFRISV